tara:strand:- start:43 stop:291 length:249 start_codon:yes stop_codon:yes gene_type:complete
MFARKAIFGIGGLLAGITLDLINFPVQTLPEEVDPIALYKLGLVLIPTVLVLLLCAFLFFIGYPITRESHEKTLQALQTKKN